MLSLLLEVVVCHEGTKTQRLTNVTHLEQELCVSLSLRVFVAFVHLRHSGVGSKLNPCLFRNLS